ncbi:hypothetical protein D3C72_1781950 [compost metagenome]
MSRKYARPRVNTVRLRRISRSGVQMLHRVVPGTMLSGSGSTAGKPTSSGLLRCRKKNSTATRATTAALEKNAACQLPIRV